MKCNHLETITLEYEDGSKETYCTQCDTFEDEKEWEEQTEISKPSLRDKMRLAGFSGEIPYEKEKLAWTETKKSKEELYNPDIENREKEMFYK